MSNLGVHFAITQDEADHLLGLEGEDERQTYVIETIEPFYFKQASHLMAESDKAWDAMRHTLEILGTPLDQVIFGAQEIDAGEDMLLDLKSVKVVQAVAKALPEVDEARFRAAYDAISEEDYAFPKSREDRDYTWEWFTNVRDLWLRARAEGRPILFSAMQ